MQMVRNLSYRYHWDSKIILVAFYVKCQCVFFVAFFFKHSFSILWHSGIRFSGVLSDFRPWTSLCCLTSRHWHYCSIGICDFLYKGLNRGEEEIKSEIIDIFCLLRNNHGSDTRSFLHQRCVNDEVNVFVI